MCSPELYHNETKKALEEAGTLLDKSVAAMVELQMMLMYARIENDVLKNKVEGE